MRAIVIALALTLVSCQHLAEFTHQEAIAEFSGMDKIYSGIPDFNLNDVPFKLIPGTLVEVELTNIKTHSVKLNVSEVNCNVELRKPIAHCTGADMHASINFKYGVRSDLMIKVGAGNAELKFHEAYLDIEFTVDSKGRPHYIPTTRLNYSIVKLNASSEPGFDEAITAILLDDVQADFNNNAYFVLNNNAKTYFDKLAEGYELTYKYTPPNTHKTIDVDMKIVRANSSMKGITWEIDGSIPGIEPAPSTLPEVNYELGKKQVIFTRQFALEFVAFANNNKFFIWNWSNGTLDLSSFDFRVADLWVIFPDSRNHYSASDPLNVQCFGDRNEDPNVSFLEENQRITFQHRFVCAVSHAKSSEEILRYTLIIDFEVSFDVNENNEAVVQVYSITPISTVILTSKYEIARRQMGLIDAITKDALWRLNSDGSGVLGTGYYLIPMQQADYIIYEHSLVIFGEPAPENVTTLTKSPNWGKHKRIPI